MKNIVLMVKDNKLDFFLELIRSFSFVKVVKKEEEMSAWKRETLAGIRKGFEEMKLVEEGKMKATPLKDFLNEL